MLVQRFAEIAVAGFQLTEEPDVLKGDGGLVGEGLDEIDLGGREGPDLRLPQPITPIGLPPRKIGAARNERYCATD